MDLVAVAWAVLRRWYVLVVFLAIGAFGAYETMTSAEQSYEVQGTYLMSTTTALGEDSEPAEAADAERGVTDAGLLAAVLNLDPRSRGGAEGGASLTAMPIADQTVRIDATATTANEAEGVLDDVIDMAMDAVAAGIEVEVVARSAATVSQAENAEAARYEAGGLLRLSGEALEGGASQVAPNYAGRILGELMRSSETQTEILGDIPSGSYNLEHDDRDQAPIVTVSAVATSPDDAVTVFDRTLASASEQLDVIQDSEGVGETNRLQLIPLVEAAAPVQGEESARRPALTILGLSGIFGAGTALALDRLLAARRRKWAFPRDEDGPSRQAGGARDSAWDARSSEPLTGDERSEAAPR